MNRLLPSFCLFRRCWVLKRICWPGMKHRAEVLKVRQRRHVIWCGYSNVLQFVFQLESSSLVKRLPELCWDARGTSVALVWVWKLWSLTLQLNRLFMLATRIFLWLGLSIWSNSELLFHGYWLKCVSLYQRLGYCTVALKSQLAVRDSLIWCDLTAGDFRAWPVDSLLDQTCRLYALAKVAVLRHSAWFPLHRFAVLKHFETGHLFLNDGWELIDLVSRLSGGACRWLSRCDDCWLAT